MEKLKPCPFCGSTNLFEHEGYIECRNCTAYGPSRTSIPPKTKPGEVRTAAEAWNMREGSPEPQVPHLMEKLNNERKEISDLKTELAASMSLPFDADGVPFRLGDEVYRLRDRQKLYVSSIERGKSWCLIHAKAGQAFTAGAYTADLLTHKKPEPPDSWEKLEKDALAGPLFYPPAKDWGPCSANDVMRDILARAKRLAGVEDA